MRPGGTTATGPEPTSPPRWQAVLRLLHLDSLKVRLAAGCLLAMLAGIGSAVWYMSQQAQQELLQVAQRREQVEASRAAAVVARRIGEVQMALRSAVGQLTPQLIADAPRLVRHFEQQAVLRAMFANIAFVAPDGSIHFHIDPGGTRFPGISIKDRAYFRQTMSEKRGVVSDPMPGRVSDEPIIAFTQPMFDDLGGVVGVLIGTFKLAARDLLADLVESRDDDLDTLILITDTNGRILAHPQRARLMQMLDDEPRLARAAVLWANDGRPLVRNAGTWASPDEIVGMAAEALTGWHIWRTTSTDSLFSPLTEARYQSTWIIRILAIAISALVVLYVAAQLRPLVRLERRAIALLEGDKHSPWPQADGEIGRVVRTIEHVWLARTRAEALNAEVLARLRSVMAAVPVGIAFTRHQTYELVSAELCRMLGRSEDQLVGQSGATIFASRDDYLALGPQVAQAFASAGTYAGEWQLVRADGSRFWAGLQARPVIGGDRSAGTIWSIHDIDAQVRDRSELQRAATHDALTGVLNRKGFERHLSDALRSGEPGSTLVMIDLDHFKPINDTAGHAAGDAVLKSVAQALAGVVRSTDAVARLGGDEFALLLRGCTSAQGQDIAHKALAAIEGAAVSWQGSLLGVSASLGVCERRPAHRDGTAWLSDADAACYEAKRAGKAGVRAAVAPSQTVA